MPDRYGFDHLGGDVRCIDCPTGGPIGRWPELKRAAHARSHGRITELRRQRNLLAVPPTTPNEEKEATTMATPSKGAPAKQVAIDVLREAGKPLHTKEIATRVLASGRCAGLKGKTPEATISAMLAVGSKPGGPFKRLDKGTYMLADAGSAASAPGPKRSGERTHAGEQPTTSEPMRAQPTGPAAAKSAQTRTPATKPRPTKRSPKRQAAKPRTAKRQPPKRGR